MVLHKYVNALSRDYEAYKEHIRLCCSLVAAIVYLHLKCIHHCEAKKHLNGNEISLQRMESQD